jgi:hypothetical protein
MAAYKAGKLQWGHGWVAVEDAPRQGRRVIVKRLQWGHGWVAVEDGRPPFALRRLELKALTREVIPNRLVDLS